MGKFNVFKEKVVSILATIFKWIYHQLIILSTLISNFFELLSTNVLPLISLLFLYGIIWFADQGQDLLITLNSKHSGPLSLYLVVILLAIINWYYPKLSQIKFQKPLKGLMVFKEKSTQPINFDLSILESKLNDDEKYKKYIPRFLGTFTILLVALGIANAQEQYLVDNPFHIVKPGTGLILLSALYYLAFATSFFERLYYYFQRLYLAICVILFLLPFIFWYFNGSTPNDLIYLVYGFSGYALLFAMITSIRTLPFPSFLQGLKQFKVLPFIIIGLVINTLYFMFFFFCNVFQNPPITILNCLPFLSFSVFISGIIVYYLFFTFLFFLKYKTQIQFPFFLIVICFVINVNSCNNFHQVRTIESKNPTQVDSLETYATKWLAKKNAPKGDTFPVFIINTYGGGIRAAAWTSFVVSYLDSITEGKFQNHIFAYSGASGGTIGASVLCANGFNKQLKDSIKRMPSKYRDFYQNDFLTPVLTGMIGNDVIYASFGIPVKDRDRGAIQEITWEMQFQKSFGSTFYSQNIDSLWIKDKSLSVPLLFSNSSEVYSGKKGIYAPVYLNSKHFPSTIFIRDLLGPSPIRLSTAAFLSARFPYISPVGRFDSLHYFLDGGIVENSGSETAQGIYQSLSNVIKKDTSTAKVKFQIYILSLKNTMDVKNETTNKKMLEMAAPISAALNAGGTSQTANKYDSINKMNLVDNYLSMRPSLNCPNEKIVLPLGWKISQFSLDYMYQSIYNTELNNNTVNKICKLVKSNKCP